MTAAPQLLDIVLLRLEFEAFPEYQRSAKADDAAPSGASSYPQGSFHDYVGRLGVEEDGETFLIATARIEDVAFPARLLVELGARFSFADVAAFKDDAVRSTLLWMMYPYMREVISSVTARSPLGAYHLPPLTKMPDPAAVEGAPDAEEDASQADAD